MAPLSLFVNDFSDGEASQASILSTLNLFSGNGDDRGENIPIKYGLEICNTPLITHKCRPTLSRMQAEVFICLFDGGR